MTHQDYNGAAPPQAPYLRPDAWRYIRPDALRLIRADLTRVLAPGMTATDAPEMDLKFRLINAAFRPGSPVAVAGPAARRPSRDAAEYFQKWDLQPETRQVFNDGTTEPVPRDTFRTSPDGVPQGHFWDGPDGAHAEYNDAVRELTDRFMNDRGISPSQITPDHAWELLGEIRESADPRIRGYNDSVRLLRRLKLLRTGRGSQ